MSDRSEVEETAISQVAMKFNRVLLRVWRPFLRWIDLTHMEIADRIPDGDEFMIDYEPRARNYIVVTDHPDPDPDEYQLGHTAGKMAMFLGMIPVFIGYLAFWLLNEGMQLFPENGITTVVLVLMSVAAALYMSAGVGRFLTLGVLFQQRGDRGAE